MRLQPVLSQDTLNAARADAVSPGQHAHAPVRGILGPLGRRHFDDPRLNDIGQRCLARLPRFVMEQPFGAGLDEPLRPIPPEDFPASVSRMMALTDHPSAISSTIITRLAIFCAVFPFQAGASSAVRSLRVSVSSCVVRAIRSLNHVTPTESIVCDRTLDSRQARNSKCQ